MKRLNIFIDETGNFGFEKTNSKLYGVSFTFHDSKNDIKNEIKYLNQKLKASGYDGMVHMADLISKRGEYKQYNIETRRKIFWAIFMFSKKIDIKIKSLIFNKNYLSRSSLKSKLGLEIARFIYENKEMITSYDKVVIYYDGGQEELDEIVVSVFAMYPNCIVKKKFNHKEKRLFQVSDMLTFIDKLDYKYKKKISKTKAEKLFFTDKEMKDILSTLNRKRL